MSDGVTCRKVCKEQNKGTVGLFFLFLINRNIYSMRSTDEIITSTQYSELCHLLAICLQIVSFHSRVKELTGEEQAFSFLGGLKSPFISALSPAKKVSFSFHPAHKFRAFELITSGAAINPLIWLSNSWIGFNPGIRVPLAIRTDPAVSVAATCAVKCYFYFA